MRVTERKGEGMTMRVRMGARKGECMGERVGE